MKLSACYVSALSLMLLSACGLPSGGPADELYLVKAQTEAGSSCMAGLPVEITAPEASPGLDTSRIAIFDTPFHLTYYTGARWAAPVPQMLRAFLIESFERSAGFDNVLSVADDMHPALMVSVSVRDFEVRNPAHPEIHVRLVATVTDPRRHHGATRRIVAERSVAPSANHMRDIIDAFNKASHEATDEIINAIADNAECAERED